MEAILKPSLPYVGSIHRSFGPGKFLKIYGMVPAGSLKFTITLQCSGDSLLHTDIALQITINLLSNNIEINSMRKGIWDDPQITPDLPIQYDERFEIVIKCDFTQYQLLINDRNCCDFPQRIAYDRVSHLAISGDVAIEQILQATELAKSPNPVRQIGFVLNEDPPPSYNELPYADIYGPFPLRTSTSNMQTNQAAVPDLNTMTPLNAASSHFQPVTAMKHKKYVQCAGCIVFIFVMIAIGIFNYKMKHSQPHSHTHQIGWDI